MAKKLIRKFPLVLMGGRADGLAYADTGARTPSAPTEILSIISILKSDTLMYSFLDKFTFSVKLFISAHAICLTYTQESSIIKRYRQK